MKLNEKIVECRKRMGISQEELALRIGVSRQAVSKWELGDATPEVDKIITLSRIFDITTDELLGNERSVSPEEPFVQDEFTAEAAAFEQGAKEEAELPRGFKLFGRVIRKWGHVAGYIVALRGLAVMVVGLIGRWMFGRVASLTVRTGMEGMIVVEEGFPAELVGEILNPSISASMDSSAAVHSIPVTFANIIIFIGAVIVAAGLALAWYLKKKSAEN